MATQMIVIPHKNKDDISNETFISSVSRSLKLLDIETINNRLEPFKKWT